MGARAASDAAEDGGGGGDGVTAAPVGLRMTLTAAKAAAYIKKQVGGACRGAAAAAVRLTRGRRPCGRLN